MSIGRFSWSVTVLCCICVYIYMLGPIWNKVQRNRGVPVYDQSTATVLYCNRSQLVLVPLNNWLLLVKYVCFCWFNGNGTFEARAFRSCKSVHFTVKMRISRCFLQRAAVMLDSYSQQLDLYSHFHPRPLSIEKFVDFGKCKH